VEVDIPQFNFLLEASRSRDALPFWGKSNGWPGTIEKVKQAAL
jgi:hypothetical protein